MKKLFSVLTVSFLIAALTLSTSALNYVDNMQDLDNNAIKTYTNLQPVSNSQVPASVQKYTGMYAFTFLNPSSPQASAQYRIQGAESVSVSIYTRLGTFASEIPWQRGSYAAGAYQTNMNHLTGSTLYPLRLGSDGMLYTNIGGVAHRMRSTDYYYELYPVSNAPGSLGGYGLNVYALSENGSRQQINLTRGSVTMNSDCCYEVFSGSVPSGAHYVLIELNDFTQVERLTVSGQTSVTSWPTGMSTILSQVSFSGTNLVLGVPESSSKGEGPSFLSSQEESSDSASSGSSSSSSKKSSSTGAAAGGGAENSSSTASSKFEGEITSTIPAGSTASTATGGKRSAASSDSSSGQGPPSALLLEEAPPREEEEIQIFRLEPDRAASSATTGLSIYIAVMTGLIIIFLLRRKSS